MTHQRVGGINVPVKVGPRAWARCWAIMALRTAVFVVNETLTRRQRAVYRAAAAAAGWGHYGLRDSPNPIFWNRLRWHRTPGIERVVKLHDAGPWVGRYPGYNAARYMTIVGLRRRRGVRRRRPVQLHAVLGVHLVSAGTKVDDHWRTQVRASSLEQIRETGQALRAAGYVAWLIGDINIVDPVDMGKGFVWLRGTGIDKVGVWLPDGMTLDDVEVHLVPAPTDHHHGLVTSSTITTEAS